MLPALSSQTTNSFQISLPEKLEQELDGILSAIYKAVETILFTNSSQSVSTKPLLKLTNTLSLATRAKIAIQKYQRETALKKTLDLFYSFWNLHARNFGTICYSNTDRLRLLTAYLLKPSKEHFKHASVILETFKRLTRAVIFNTRFTPSEACLKPSQFFNQRAVYFKILNQKEILSPQHFEIKQIVLEYLKSPYQMTLPPFLLLLLDYLKGIHELDDLPLTTSNARAFLVMGKIIDLAIGEYNRSVSNKLCFRSSFELRSRILEMCSPSMTTGEAYTKTLDIRKFKDRIYLSNPANWVPERIGIHLKILSKQLISLLGLSLKQHQIKPSISIMRGNTAAGKSTGMPNEFLFHHLKDNYGKISGICSVDSAKMDLRSKKRLVNNQVHEESAAIFNEMLAKIFGEANKTSLLLEGRFSSIEEIENVLGFANARNAEIVLFDIETLLIISLLRVLERDPFTHQCPPVREIVKGYKESALHLKKLVERVGSESAIKSYKLYYNGELGKKHLVAEKKQGRLIIYSEEFLEKSCAVPSDFYINQMLVQPITEELINNAIGRNYIAEESKKRLLQWVDIPLGYAIDKHGFGLEAEEVHQQMHIDSIWKELYGEYELQSFDGEWLSDFPLLKKHIDSEHRLHIRGEGLHFQAGKFNWKLNPEFNPEARLEGSPHGGIQMKIGYFMVPLSHVDTFVTKSLSPAVLKELEVYNQKANLIGYRLFVHPEAYTHFKALHAAGIRFVKPKDSEFMGAPTSSYRSWIVRRLSDKETTVPFIAKFGVASSLTEIRRLLPRSEIEKSIKAQKALDALPEDCFFQEGQGKDLIFFKENFGMALKNIQNYPPTAEVGEGATIDSGLIIREIPEELFILSFSAIMSVERTKSENIGLCGKDKKYDGLPLIFELIEVAIQKGLVKSSEEFINTYIIKNYFEAIEDLHMRHGISLASHGQNLCLVLNQDYTIRGFAYRDMEGVSLDPKEKFLESYALFRHHIVTKIANVLLCHEEWVAPQKGAPTQLGSKELLPERALFRYIVNQINHQGPSYRKSIEILLKRHINPPQYKQVIKVCDEIYLAMLRHYYELDASGVVKSDGTLPAAESGSESEYGMQMGDLALCKHKKMNLPVDKCSIAFTCTISQGTYFDHLSIMNNMSIRMGSSRFTLPNGMKPLSQNPLGKKRTESITIKDIERWHNLLGGLSIKISDNKN